jgi:hypothetical protein
VELNFKNLDLTAKVTENDSVRNHDVSIVFVVPGTKILEEGVVILDFT